MDKNEAVITVLFERFNKVVVPRIKKIKAKVEAGETMNEEEIHFFESVLEEIRQNQHLVQTDEELQLFLARAIHMDMQIISKALENEQNQLVS